MTTGFNKTSFVEPASTSGLLCLSTICEAKFSRHKAAVNVALTAFKYGFKVLDFCKFYF
jgi:hypothetical protein